MHVWLETESGTPISQRAASIGPGEEAPHLIIVLARSQTEVPRDAAHARVRLVEIPKFFNNITETDDSTVGEIGTYVMSRTGGPTAAEVILRSRR